MPSSAAQARLDQQIIDELLTSRAGKWTMPVVLHLRGHTRRFSELLRELHGISQKALSSTLRHLERDGFISRTSFATIPPRVDYALTELGEDLLEVFAAWEQFANRHWSQVLEARARFEEASHSVPEPFQLPQLYGPSTFRK